MTRPKPVLHLLLGLVSVQKDYVTLVVVLSVAVQTLHHFLALNESVLDRHEEACKAQDRDSESRNTRQEIRQVHSEVDLLCREQIFRARERTMKVIQVGPERVLVRFLPFHLGCLYVLGETR